MKILNAMKNKYNQAVVGATSLVVAGSASASETTSSVDQLFSSVDLAGVTANVVTIGGTVLGIFLAYKGIVLVKRAINKA